MTELAHSDSVVAVSAARLLMCSASQHHAASVMCYTLLLFDNVILKQHALACRKHVI